MLSDFRYAFRQLRGAPGFALAAVISLALGIGANAAIFSVGNALLLRPLRGGVELVRVYRNHHSPLTYAEITAVAEQTRGTFADIVGERMLSLARTDGSEPEKLTGSIVAGNLFPALGVRPALGRLFTGADTTAESALLVVLSHRYWERRLGGDPAVVGRVLRINGQPFTVAGVAEADFTSSVMPWRPDVFFTSAASLPLTGQRAEDWGGSLYTTARLRDGVSRAQADAALRVAALRIAAADTARYAGDRFTLRTDHVRGVNAELRTPVAAGTGLLLGVVSVVLLIACANVANLLLARATTRGREVGVRVALGASRARLVRQLLTESVVLAAAGGAVGLFVASWATRALGDALTARAPEPVLVNFAPDATVTLYTLGLTVATALLFGLVPALRASRPAVLPALKDGAGGAVGTRSRLRGTLVGVQVALCTLCLAVASLLVHSLSNARRMDPGFDSRGVLDAAIDVQSRRLDAPARREFFRRLVEQARALPGVRSASLAALVPLGGSNMQTLVWVAGARGDRPDGSRLVYFNTVGTSYFATLGLPVVRGREFTDADRDGAPGALVVNETMARRLWPDGDALGRRVSLDGPSGPWLTVVGVARDAKYNSVGEDTPPFMYLAAPQSTRAELVLHVRAADPAAVPALGRTLRAMVTSFDPLLPPPTVTTIEDDMRISMLPAQLGAAFTAVFGGVALLLAAVGIYGVVAFAVARRTREIGVRAALGAAPSRIVRRMMGEAGRAVAVGLAVGLVLALLIEQLMGSILYGIGAVDPVTLVAAPLVLTGAAALAAYLPARRATRVSPTVALRSE
jgi:predicted permease